jgi:hypothetical protein
MKYYDEDGNELDISLSPEEIKKAIDERDNLSKLKDDLEKKEKDLTGELTKLRSKDFNFGKYRAATEKEKDEMTKKFTGEQLLMLHELDTVKSDLDTFKERTGATRRNNILESMAGKDPDLRKQIEDAYKGFAGDPKDEKEEFQRYVNAFTIVKGSRPDIEQINAYTPSSVAEDFRPTKATDWTRTPEGEKFYAENFPNLAQKK